MEDNLSDLLSVPADSRAATKYILDKLLNEIHPTINQLQFKIQAFIENAGEATKINEVYSLCLSQITKCLLNLFDIFRLEYSRCTVLQESRQCNLDRLSWCLDRLVTIDKYLDKNLHNSDSENANESLNETTMYFVNWIDHAFENLNKLSEVVYKTDYKTEDLCEMWKVEMVQCITGLYISVDELLLCAMTLCRYCLPADQHIIKARCQVVLRETKALLSELIEGDVSSTLKATTDSLKLPVMPSNVSVTIDVLKDALYVLETNTNTTLLGLLIHCFSNNTSPVDVLKAHFTNGCSCESNLDATDDCEFVKEFDLYNERLLQIGSFAVSCSVDQKRILALRSGLASLEALDPHLVPALMTSPHSVHATWLIKSWRMEVEEIRNSVFLIVDPAAFASKSKQMMHQNLLDVLKEDTYNNTTVCSVISIACVVVDFFNVYIQTEPDALTDWDKLQPLINDLQKVTSECKIVSNLLSSATDFTYDIKTPTDKSASTDQLNKRLKLLYTLVSRINSLLQPIEEDEFFEEEETPQNVTHTIPKKGVTYVNSPRKVNRSMFARTNVRSSTRNLSKVTKNLRVKCTELNFSLQLDELFNITENKNVTRNKRLDNVRESSVLYNFSPIKNRSSLRKVVLNRHLQNTKGLENDCGVLERESLFNDDESLQLTEIINEINDITSVISSPKRMDRTTIIIRQDNIREENIREDNILTINVGNQNSYKNIWNIPVNSSMVEMRLDQSEGDITNITQPSNVTTLERITDLDFVESKLSSLKSQMETSL